jgi:hypothetical protein
MIGPRNDLESKTGFNFMIGDGNESACLSGMSPVFDPRKRINHEVQKQKHKPVGITCQGKDTQS